MTENDLWKKVGAVGFAGLAVAGLTGFAGHALGENSYDADMANKLMDKDVEINKLEADVSSALDAVSLLKSKVSALEQVEPEVVVAPLLVDGIVYDEEGLKALLVEKESALADARSALDKLEKYDDELESFMLNDAAFAEVGILMDAEGERSEDYEDLYEDLKEDLIDAVRGLDWVLEDEDDLISVSLLDNDDKEVNVEDDDDGVEGTVLAEVKVKFREHGPDGDRHSEYLMVEFKLEEGEISAVRIVGE